MSKYDFLYVAPTFSDASAFVASVIPKGSFLDQTQTQCGLSAVLWRREQCEWLFVCLQGPECCSDSSVSFHYVPADSMYMFEYFVYHLRPFGASSYLVVSTPSVRVLPAVVHFNHSSVYDARLKLTPAVATRNVPVVSSLRTAALRSSVFSS